MTEDDGKKPDDRNFKPRQRAGKSHDPILRQQASGIKSTLKVMPAWLVSAVVHVLTLGLLTLATFATSTPTEKKSSFDASPYDTKVAPEEVVQMLTDPSDDPTRTLSSAANASDLAAAEAPSPTPAVSETGKYSRPEDLTVDVVVPKITTNFVMPMASKLLVGQSGFKGDVQPASEVGEALDQISREILVQLGRQRVVVAWLFDESESMRDDQQAILAKFDRIMAELTDRVDETTQQRDKNLAGNDKAEIDPRKKNPRRKSQQNAEPLRHIIIGFGDQFDLMQEATSDRKKISDAVNKLRVDTTGTENTMGAIGQTLRRYGSLSTNEQMLMIVLVTDESADDFASGEEVMSACKQLRVPVFVIGRQAMFGTDRLQYRWVDPQTKDVYWTSIRRGPESAMAEALQWDGLHPRREDQPSGFAPYDLARLTKETGGRYFLLPTAENERVRQIEKAYNYNDIRELSPDYEGRSAYIRRLNGSRLRTAIAQIIEQTRNFGMREEFPINPAEAMPAIVDSAMQARQRLAVIANVEKQLKALERDRDRDPERRWQANYDLMLAQLVYSQVKLTEYIALMESWAKEIQSGKPPVPQNKPGPDKIVSFTIGHRPKRIAPAQLTDAKIEEAKKLFTKVQELYPNTPWADLSRDLQARGFSVGRGEWARSPLYQDRSKLVPKF
jgi:hypothetical protein